MRNAETVLGVLRERGKRRWPLERIYRLLYNPELYLLFVDRTTGRIYSNKGAMTPGVNGETADGMSMEKIERIIDALRHERYRFSPVRRVYIPKKNGKLRPLGMPTWSDKLVGEVVRLILGAYYEPQFSDLSHGFRPRRGCHTALRDVAETWTGTTWFIEGDISDCFGSLDHEIMVGILAEKIRDNRFLRLVRNMLQAGYLEDWIWGATLSGAPQGGVVSPILSNVYLHKLDYFVERILIPHYTQGERRASNPAYQRITSAIERARKHGDREKTRELRKRQRLLPSHDPEDPGYRRLRYVRYADDHLLGFTGPKSEAEKIKARLAQVPARRPQAGTEPGENTDHARLHRGGEIPRLRDHRPEEQHQDHPRPPVRQRIGQAARAQGGDQGEMRPVLQARRTRAADPAGEQQRPGYRRHLRVRVPGNRPVLPLRHEAPCYIPDLVGKNSKGGSWA